MSDNDGPISPSYMYAPSSMPSTPKSPLYAPSPPFTPKSPPSSPNDESDEPSGLEWSPERKKRGK